MNNARIYSRNSTVTSGSGKKTLGTGPGSMTGTPTFEQNLTKKSLTLTRDDHM